MVPVFQLFVVAHYDGGDSDDSVVVDGGDDDEDNHCQELASLSPL